MHQQKTTMTTQEQRITKAKQSCAFTPEELIGAVVSKDLFDGVAQGIAKNVKMGPFKATSGLVIPCTLLMLCFNTCQTI